MSSDYKYEMQMIAEDLAEQKYGREFYNLPKDTQYQIFLQAEEVWMDKAITAAELLVSE